MALLVIAVGLSLFWFGLIIINNVITSKRKAISDIEKITQINNYARPLETLQKVSSLSLIIIFSIIFYRYFNSDPSFITPHIMEWLNLIVRWVHIVFGIAWIGASFYFIFLENSLNRTEGLKDDIAGNLWAIHGGGFYYVEKYKIAPTKIPKELHWFKYEAYFTWLTGFLLLFIVYYLNASTFLIDKSIYDISENMGIAIGIGTLIGSWVFYDLLCKSPIVKNNNLFFFVILIFTTIAAYGLCQVFTGRAAYMHIGALLGTIMAANVFFVIIPSQKALVKAATEGLTLDPSLGEKAGMRSLHNNYFTLPVIFIMISNHFPSTFGNEFNWAVLVALSLVSIAIKHFWNVYERGKVIRWILPASLISLIGLALVTAPKNRSQILKEAPIVNFIEIQNIINDRCTSCHSSNPSDDVWKTAPNGVVFDTPLQIAQFKDRILNRVVSTKTMPQGNKTEMTQSERDAIEIWVFQGAIID